MRHLVWIAALAVGFVAFQTWNPGNSAQLASIDIGALQMQADKAMPVMVIDNAV